MLYVILQDRDRATGEEMEAVARAWVSSPSPPLLPDSPGRATRRRPSMLELTPEDLLLLDEDRDDVLLDGDGDDTLVSSPVSLLGDMTVEEEEEDLAAEAIEKEVAGVTLPSLVEEALDAKRARRVPSIYHPKENASIIEAPLVVSLAAVFLWPTLLLVITICSMLLVTYFRIIRSLAQVVYRKQTVEADGEDNGAEDLDVGLYWFGKGNICEKAKDLGKPSRFFDPNKKSVIYVHGFQRRTTARRFRETFNWYHNDQVYGLDIDAADAWIDEGWNVGIFYWNYHADEETPQDSECKIWTSNGRTGMRMRAITAAGRVTYVSSPRAAPSISHQLCEILAATFANSPSTYRLVGHSLGSQVVVHASKLLLQEMASNPSICLPTRIALLDVFSTVGMKAYASGWPILVVIQRELAELREVGVILEQYQTSLIGRRGLRFQNQTAWVELDPGHIPWYKLKSRHIAAPYLYFLSMGDGVNPRQAELRRKASQALMARLKSNQALDGAAVAPPAPSEEEEEGPGHHSAAAESIDALKKNGLRAMFSWAGYREVEMGDFPAMARASDDAMRELMESGYVYRQWRGRYFLRVARPWS